MKVLKFSFLFYAIWLVLGILSTDYLSMEKSRIGLLLGTILLFLFCFKPFYKRLYSKSYFFYLNVVLFSFSSFMLGNVSKHIQEYKRTKNNVVLIKNSEEDNSYVIRLDKKLKSSHTYNRYIGSVLQANDEIVQGNVLLQVLSDTLKIGDVVLTKGKLQAFNSSRNIGQFDYQKYMFNQGVDRQIFIKDYSVVGESDTFLVRVYNWRNTLIHRIQSSAELNEYSKGLLCALLLGERGGIDEFTQNSFKELGVMHVLAISGLHIGIVYMFLVVLLGRIPVRIRMTLIIVLLWLFVFLSGFSPSVFRAVLMFSAIAFAKGLKRNTNTLHIVSLAFFLSLLFKPMWLFDVGFQLSYTAVFGIVWIMPLFKKFRNKRRIVRYIQELIIVSLVAQISVLPLQLYYFGQLPVFFLPANLFVIPLVTLLIVGGIVWIFISFISPLGSIYLAKIINVLSDCLIYSVQYVNQLEWTKGIKCTITGVQAFFIGMFLFVMVLFFFYRKKRILFVSALSLLLFQIDYKFHQPIVLSSEWVVPYGFKRNFEVFDRVGNELIVYTDSLDSARTASTDYLKVNSIEAVKIEKEPYYYSFGSKRILHLNEEKDLYDYATTDSISHLLFSGKVKINFDRVIAQLHPEEVIIHNSVPFWIKNYIITSCNKKKIPYYDISTKGFYRISL
ncbi:MAG: ComEC family competence protein [Flavobacteriaceae bacterium]|jgi:competence protein ComEC|nr:ComEC family competence protein [Flavobacteriaceae bacterium]